MSPNQTKNRSDLMFDADSHNPENNPVCVMLQLRYVMKKVSFIKYQLNLIVFIRKSCLFRKEAFALKWDDMGL